jgi:hypothetical protein
VSEQVLQTSVVEAGVRPKLEVAVLHAGDADADSTCSAKSASARASEISSTTGCSTTATADSEGGNAQEAGQVKSRALFLLSEFRALDAEAALREARLLGGASFDPRLGRYLDMYNKVKDYTLSNNSDLTWTTVYKDSTLGQSSKLELSWQPGSTSGWMRQVLEVKAPLDWCMVPSAEDWGADRAEAITKEPVGTQSRLRRLNHAMLNLLLGFAKYDLLSENLRFPNHKSGFLAEHIESPDLEDRSLPPLPSSPKGFTRIHASTYNLWLPKVAADGSDATILVQVVKIDAGFRVPAWLLKQGFWVAAPQMMKKFRLNAQLAAKPGKQQDRLNEDPHGFYAELRKVMESARQKQLANTDGETVTADRLPPASIFDDL